MPVLSCFTEILGGKSRAETQYDDTRLLCIIQYNLFISFKCMSMSIILLSQKNLRLNLFMIHQCSLLLFYSIRDKSLIVSALYIIQKLDHFNNFNTFLLIYSINISLSNSNQIPIWQLSKLIKCQISRIMFTAVFILFQIFTTCLHVNVFFSFAIFINYLIIIFSNYF